MKITTKSLGIGIVIGLVVGISVIFILITDVIFPTSSVYPEDMSKPIPQDYLAFINPSLCSSTKEIDNASGIFYECIFTSSNVTGIGNLPSPIFKLVNSPTTSGYGNLPPRYVLSISNLLSSQQIEKIIDIIRNDPPIKSQPFAWKISSFELYPYKYSWHVDVHLVIHGIRPVNHLGDCGWMSKITVNLNDLTITKRENTDVISYEKC